MRVCVCVCVCVVGVAAGSLVLNVAQQPLLQILQRSSLSVSPPGAPRTTGETALYMPIATTAVRSKPIDAGSSSKAKISELV